MNEVKKLLAQVKIFADSQGDDLSDPILESLIGQEFSTQIEIEKNREFQKFLRMNTALQPELRLTNEVVHSSLRVFEKKLLTERLRDFNSALKEVMRSASLDVKEFGHIQEEVRMMVEKSNEFKHSTLKLEEEVQRLEDELMEYMSLPYMHDQADFPILSDELSIGFIEGPRATGTLKVLPASSNETIEPPADFKEVYCVSVDSVVSAEKDSSAIPGWARPPQTNQLPRDVSIPDASNVSCLVVVKASDFAKETTPSRKFSEIEALATRFRNQR